jgi:hypothetical protein
MTAQRTDAVHPDPVWRERADFVIGAPLPEEGRAEQLWAREVSGQRLQICCIPFFLYDVALGDIVETDANYDLLRVVKPSGRYVFRVWFGDSSFSQPERTAEQLRALGALLEWSSANLVAIDAADEHEAQRLSDFLTAEERCGRLTFEAGRS